MATPVRCSDTCACWSMPGPRARPSSSTPHWTPLRPGALWEFYGSTEGQFTTCSPEEWLERPGTVGRARPGRTLAIDADGTIWCRPPAFAAFRYWDDDAKTEAAWRDGFFTVGDLGHLGADGYLFIDGRRDDLIISGGVNVYPAEVEAVLAEVRRGGRRCRLRYARRPVGPTGVRCSGGAAGTIGGRARRRRRPTCRLAAGPYKRPKQYVIVEALPRTATGKVQRHRLPS